MNLPLDVFYISILSEGYKGSKLAFIKGIITAFLFAFQSVFNKRRSSSVIYILRKSTILCEALCDKKRTYTERL